MVIGLLLGTQKERMALDKGFVPIIAANNLIHGFICIATLFLTNHSSGTPNGTPYSNIKRHDLVSVR
jgi:hypothetical protein